MMQRWLMFGLGLGLICLAAGWWAWSRQEQTSKGIILEWHEVAWGDETSTSPTTGAAGFEYRTVRLRNDSAEDIVPVLLFADAMPDQRKSTGLRSFLAVRRPLRPAANHS